MRREPNAAKDRFLSLVSLRSIIMRQKEFYQSPNPQAAASKVFPIWQVVPPLEECALPTFKMSSDFCTGGHTSMTSTWWGMRNGSILKKILGFMDA